MSVAARNLRDAVITIKDGSPTPNTLIVSPDNGDLSFTVHSPTVTILNRGSLHSKRAGNDQEVDVSFSFMFTQWENAMGVSGVSVPDALQKRGGASAWVTADTNVCNIYCVNLVFQITDPCDPTKKETIAINNFHAESLVFTEGETADKISVTGKAFVTTVDSTYA